MVSFPANAVCTGGPNRPIDGYGGVELNLFDVLTDDKNSLLDG